MDQIPFPQEEPIHRVGLQGIIVVTRVPECAVRAGIFPVTEFLDVTPFLINLLNRRGRKGNGNNHAM